MNARRWLHDGFTLVHGIIFVIAAVFHVWFWIRRGLWVPTYVHVMALIALMIGLWLEPVVPDEAPVRAQGVLGYLMIMLIFPAIVDGTFVLLGGPKEALDAKTRPPDYEEFD
jgi:drug/metabolite transporter superfamily protein YnfA